MLTGRCARRPVPVRPGAAGPRPLLDTVDRVEGRVAGDETPADSMRDDQLTASATDPALSLAQRALTRRLAEQMRLDASGYCLRPEGEPECGLAK